MREKNKVRTLNRPSRLVSAIADLNEELALSLVKESLANGVNPGLLIKECQEGLKKVGERYRRQIYYLSGLVMGGEILREITELIKSPVPLPEPGQKPGKVLIGTVAGDIHDLGKNIVKMILTSNDFSVIDLGVDVPPAEFVKQVKETAPDIVGLSGLITHAYDSMRITIDLLRKEGCRQPIIIGGSLLNGEVFKYIGANYWVTDAYSGLQICRKLIAKSD
jgi:methanogenic corrinoid protein MtbC1